MFGGSRGWIAMGTLAAYAVMGGTKSALAYGEKAARRRRSRVRGKPAAEAVQYPRGTAGRSDCGV